MQFSLLGLSILFTSLGTEAVTPFPRFQERSSLRIGQKYYMVEVVNSGRLSERKCPTPSQIHRIYRRYLIFEKRVEFLANFHWSLSNDWVRRKAINNPEVKKMTIFANIQLLYFLWNELILLPATYSIIWCPANSSSQLAKLKLWTLSFRCQLKFVIFSRSFPQK